MASRELSILVTAKNMASKVLGQVKGDVKGLDSAASKAGSNVARNIGLGVAAVGTGLAIQVKAGVDSLVELERVNNLTAAALESTGNAANQSVEGIRARSEALETMTGVDDKVLQNAQNLLLTFPQIEDKAFEPTLEAAVNLNAALGGGDEGLQGVLLQVAKAVNDPIRGMTALRRSGVSFTKAQQDQVKEMVEANDMMGAQAIVLGELEQQFGGAAEAANKGVGGSQKRFADAIEDMQMALATGFLPLIERASGMMSRLVADPAFMAGVEAFGDTLASGFDEALNFAESVDWGAVGDALMAAGSGARMAMDAFLGAPAWLQTAILTGWGLNKVTGGVLGSLVGELGKGLIKGILNMNAGVVNINAATVNGGGGLPGAAGKAGGFLGGLGKGLLTGGVVGGAAVLGGIAVKMAADFDAQRDQAQVNLRGQILDVNVNDPGALADRIASVTAEINKERPLLEGLLFNTNVRPVLEDGLADLKAEQARAAVDITRGTTAVEQATKTAAARAAGSDAAMLNAARTAHGVLVHQRNLAQAAQSSDRAMLATAATQSSRLTTIANKRTTFNPNVNVTANLHNTVVVSGVQTVYRLNSLRQSLNSGTSVDGFI